MNRLRIGGMVIALLTLAAGGMLFTAFNHPKAAEQPLAFSHKSHAGGEQIPCLYCHIEARRSAVAGVPTVKLCMGCHASLKVTTSNPQQLQALAQLQAHWEKDQPISWVRVYNQPDHVRFSHQRHLVKGIDCEACHGPVQTMERTQEAIVWTMARCVSCHMEQKASIDCITCHK